MVAEQRHPSKVEREQRTILTVLLIGAADKLERLMKNKTSTACSTQAPQNISICFFPCIGALYSFNRCNIKYPKVFRQSYNRAMVVIWSQFRCADGTELLLRLPESVKNRPDSSDEIIAINEGLPDSRIPWTSLDHALGEDVQGFGRTLALRWGQLQSASWNSRSRTLCHAYNLKSLKSRLLELGAS